jgi:hypothetical protein
LRDVEELLKSQQATPLLNKVIDTAAEIAGVFIATLCEISQ